MFAHCNSALPAYVRALVFSVSANKVSFEAGVRGLRFITLVKSFIRAVHTGR